MIKSIKRANRDGGRAFLGVAGRRAEKRFMGSGVEVVDVAPAA